MYRVPWHWEGLVVMTGILFGCLIKSHWAYRKSGRLWLSLACLLVAHLATGVVLVSRIQKVKLVWFVIIFIPELQLINAPLRIIGLRPK